MEFANSSVNGPPMEYTRSELSDLVRGSVCTANQYEVNRDADAWLHCAPINVRCNLDRLVHTYILGTCEASIFDSNSNRPFRLDSIRQ